MAWKDVKPMEERVSFVMRACREDVTMTEVCEEFGISRKTGYKWLKRYRAHGLSGMHELSRRPHKSPNRIEERVEELVIRERRRHRTWGPKKLRDVLSEKYDLEKVPAGSTIGNIIERHGLTRKRRRRRTVSKPDRRRRREATRPNEVWGADFKGWFRTKDGQRCDPLTVSDIYSRYVLACQLVRGQRIENVKPEFRKVFRRYGLPEVIRVDNGSPFGSRGVLGLSMLSAWWVQLGIDVEFIEPGHPEQNSVHERMHRTLKDETARPPSSTPQGQQRRFNRWRREFNHERPHEALGMERPAQRYRRSSRRFTERPTPPRYPPYYEVRKVQTHGSIKWKGKFYYIGSALYGMALGLTDVAEGENAVYFGDLLLGYLSEGPSGGLRPPASAPQTPPDEEG
jgi:transposase InsO family protein